MAKPQPTPRITMPWDAEKPTYRLAWSWLENSAPKSSLFTGKKVKKKELDPRIKHLEDNFDSYTKHLPSVVKSTRTSVIHRNNKVFICAPAHMWQTLCGWCYYNSDYKFSEGDGTMVTCQKWIC